MRTRRPGSEPMGNCPFAAHKNCGHVHACHAPPARLFVCDSWRKREGAQSHEGRAGTDGNKRVLPRRGHGGINLRARRHQRRQAGLAAAQRRAHYHRHARQDPSLHGRVRRAQRTAHAIRELAARGPRPSAQLPHRRPRRRSRNRRRTAWKPPSASTTTGRSTCCSSTPAARSGRSPTASRRKSATPIRARRRSGCSMRAWATAACSRASCAPCTTGTRPCPSTSSARRSASRTCASPCRRWSTASSSIRRPCLVLTNLQYASAPWLTVKSLSAASSLLWHEVRLQGNTGHSFERQISALEPFLATKLDGARVTRAGTRPTSARSCS